MSVYRAPTVALMPDITPSPLRSKANGIINFMGGLAAVIVTYLEVYYIKPILAYPFHLSSHCHDNCIIYSSSFLLKKIPTTQ